MTGGAAMLRRLLRKPTLGASVLVLLVVVGAALLSPFLPFTAYRQDVLHRNAAPSSRHILGTDELGRDVVARLAVGARVSLIVAVTSSVIAVAIGVMTGMLAGYLGGLPDTLLMRFIDSMYAFPETLFAIVIAAFVKGQLASQASGLLAVLVTLGLTCWLTTARLVRSQVISLKNAEYVLACRLSGGTDWFIIRTHLLPNALPVILIAITFVVPNAILLEAGLSFIGVGIDPPTPSWGTMIASGVQSLQSYPHLLVAPALAIGATLLALNVVGDALRDGLDPALRGSRAG